MNGLCPLENWGTLGNFAGMGGAGWILHLVIWIGLIAALTLLVVWTVRRVRFSPATVPGVTGQPTAGENLKAQYARGEITREQYEAKKRDGG